MAKTTNKDQFELRLGYFAEYMGASLRKMGVKYEARTMRVYQKDMRHIHSLLKHAILTQREAERAYVRLVVQIKTHIRQHA